MKYRKRMRKMKMLLSVILCLCMTAGMLPMKVLAEEVKADSGDEKVIGEILPDTAQETRSGEPDGDSQEDTKEPEGTFEENPLPDITQEFQPEDAADGENQDETAGQDESPMENNPQENQASLSMHERAAQQGTGTGSSEETPLHVDSREFLVEAAKYINDGTIQAEIGLEPGAEVYFQLTADIDMEGFGDAWIPIGNESYPFQGQFDGNGHTISGLRVNQAEPDQTYAGLFGVIGEQGSVQKLTLLQCTVNGNAAGAMAGRNDGEISNCAVDAQVSGKNNTGGICAEGSGSVKACLFTGTVLSENGTAGGICGETSGVIESCAALAKQISAAGGASENDIAGSLKEGGKAENNISWTGCTGGGVSDGDGTQRKTSEELQISEGWPGALRQEPWVYEEGFLPSLGGEKSLLPAYLQVLEGTGTKKDPYHITSWNDFETFVNSVNEGNNYKERFVKLDDAIEMPEEVKNAGGILPMDGFQGTFDGGHKAITGLTVNQPERSSVGMFGRAEGAVVKNVVLKDVNITGYKLVGGVMGEGHDVNISGCYVDGSVKALEKDVGAVLGSGFTSVVESCYAAATVRSDGHGAGGIQSYMEGGAVRDCFAAGAVSSYYAGSVAGIVAHPEQTDGIIERCYSTSKLSADSSTLAGIRTGTGGVVGVSSGTMNSLIALNEEVGDIDGSYGPVVGNYLSDAVVGEGLAYWCMMRGNTIMEPLDPNSAGYSAKQLKDNTDGIWDAFDQSDAWTYKAGTLPFVNGVPKELQKMQNDGWPEWLVDKYETLYGDKPPYEKTAVPGIGTYKVSTAGHLAWLSMQDYDTLNNQNIEFDASKNSEKFISLKDYQGGSGWRPIGQYDDVALSQMKIPSVRVRGNGFTVSDLYIYQPRISKDTAIGLFGALGDGSSVDDLHVENVSIRANSLKYAVYAGGLVGFGVNITLDKCSFDGNIEGGKSSSAGGIIGTVRGLTTGAADDSKVYEIKSCASRGKVEGDLYAGGILGRVDYESSGVGRENVYTLTYCYNMAEIKGETAGGVAGHLYLLGHDLAKCNGKINLLAECYNRGSVEGNRFAGGMLGGLKYFNNQEGTDSAMSVNIDRCYNTGAVRYKITSDNSACGGGIVGRIQYTRRGATTMGKKTIITLSGYSLGPSVEGEVSGDGIDTSNANSDPFVGRIEGLAGDEYANTTIEKYGYLEMWDKMALKAGDREISVGDDYRFQGDPVTKLNSLEIVEDKILKDRFELILEAINAWNRSGTMPILKDGYTSRPEWQSSTPPSHILEDIDWGLSMNGSTYVIDSPEKLVAASQKYKYGISMTLDLQADIDMRGVEGFQPFEEFNGTFKGNGYTISNLNIQKDGDNVGFFASIDQGRVSDLALVDCSVSGGKNVGMLAGTSRGKITGCYAARSPEAMSAMPDAWQVTGEEAVGGLVGSIEGSLKLAPGQLSDCYAAVNVKAGVRTPGNGAGGLAGRIYVDKADMRDPLYALVSRCFAAGAVQGASNVGGLYGSIQNHADNQAEQLKLDSCFSLSGSLSTGSDKADTDIGLIYGSKEGEAEYEYQTAWIGQSGLKNISKDTSYPNMNGTKEPEDGKTLETHINRLMKFGGSAWKEQKGGTPILAKFNGEQYNYLPQDEKSQVLEKDQGDGAYLIRTAQDMALMAEKVSGGFTDYVDASYRLVSDIRLSNVADLKTPWRPIQNFSGSFDGGGHTITLADYFVSGDQGGLFGTVEAEAEIKDLKLSGVIGEGSYSSSGGITQRSTYFGMLAARMKGSVANVWSSGSISAKAENVGGIVGLLETGGSLDECRNSAMLSINELADGSPYAGGIAGSVYGSITGSTNTAPIQVNDASPGWGNAGGIAGLLKDNGTVRLCRNIGLVSSGKAGGIVSSLVGNDNVSSGEIAVIERCVSTGIVRANYQGGGIAASCQYGVVKNCYSASKVTSSIVTRDAASVTAAGGIAGVVTQSASVSQCYSIADVKGQKDTAGIDAAGGIVGGMEADADKSSTLEYSAALNHTVESEEAGSSARVLGYGNGGINLQSVYGYEGMVLDGSMNDKNGSAGEDVSREKARDKETFWKEQVQLDMDTVWSMDVNPAGESTLPVLQGISGQTNTWPLYLNGYEQGQGILMLDAESKEVDYSEKDREVKLWATLISDSNEKALEWSVDPDSAASGVHISRDPDNYTFATLFLPKGYVGETLVTVKHAVNSRLTAMVNIKALPLNIPDGLTAVYGDKLSTVKLPADGSWTWKDPDALVGDAGKQNPVAVYHKGKDSELEKALPVDVKKRPITVTADHKFKYVGDPDPEFTWKITEGNLAGDDKLGGKLGYISQGDMIGSYDIILLEPFDNPNYEISYTAGQMEIRMAVSAEAVVQMIENLPQPVQTHADADQVVEATRAYGALTAEEQGQIDPLILQKLTTAQEQSGTVNRQNGEYLVEGTFLPWSVRLEVQEIKDSDDRFTLVEGLLKEKELLSLYDFSLVDTMTGEKYLLPEEKTVVMELRNTPVSGREEVEVIHVTETGQPEYTIVVLEYEVNGSTIRFETSGFSMYGLTAGVKKQENPEPDPGPGEPENPEPGPGPQEPDNPKPNPGPQEPETPKPDPGQEKPETLKPVPQPQKPDTKQQSGSVQPNQKSEVKKTAAKTGDVNYMTLYLFLVLVSGGLVIGRAMKRKNTKRKK